MTAPGNADRVPTHRVTGLQTVPVGDSWHATATCSCGCWAKEVGPYWSQLLARRVARGYQRRHRKAAERGVLTVTWSPQAPEIVATPEDERAFLAEAARGVTTPPPVTRLADLGLDGVSPGCPAAVVIVAEALHPATLKDLEQYGELASV